jgi:hypothetical protein
MANDTSAVSLGDLFADLSRQTTELIHRELALAKRELSQKAAELGSGLTWMAASAAIAMAGFLSLVAGIVLALVALGVPPWAAALGVGVVCAGTAYGLARHASAAFTPAALTPQHTIDSLKEGAQWMKRAVRT